jgi:hypothetical protein
MKSEDKMFYAKIVGIVFATGVLLFAIKKLYGKNKSNSKLKSGKSIVIGDSQTPYIAKQSQKADLLGNTAGENVLWKGGQNLKWVKDAVSKYPVSKDVSNVIISIGTNGGFNANDDISGLVQELKRVFPNANLIAVKGSWNWGYNTEDRGVNENKVNKYYGKFSNLGVKVIPTPIGPIEPHGDKPVYKQIGKEIDNII